MMTIAEMFGCRMPKLPNCERAYRGAPPTKEVIESTRHVGIEVEVENLTLEANPKTGVWVNTTDGSLRNNGAEWITLPIEARFAPYALRELLADSLSKDCCFSPRTSTHVHVNCQDLTIVQVQDILLLYGCLEPLYFQFTGRGRIKNIYCVPIMDTSMIAMASTQKLEATMNLWSKYTGFNILPLSDKGTIEWRHMHGTFDHEKLSVWIRLIVNLVDYVLNQGTASIRKIVSSFGPQTDVFGLLLEVFGREDLRQFSDPSYVVIKDAVNNTKLAFLKNTAVTELVKERNLKSPYFIKG